MPHIIRPGGISKLETFSKQISLFDEEVRHQGSQCCEQDRADCELEIVGDEEGLHCRELQELLDITLDMDMFYQTFGFTTDKYELNFDFN